MSATAWIRIAMGTGLGFFILPSCDFQDTTLKALETTTCAIDNEVLSVAFSDPPRAVNALKKTVKDARGGDTKAIRDALDLLDHMIGCLE